MPRLCSPCQLDRRRLASPTMLRTAVAGCLALAAVAGMPSPSQAAPGGGFDGLLSVLPDSCDSVSGSDHDRLRAHPSYAKALAFMGSQGWVDPAFTLAGGLRMGADVSHVVSCRRPAGEGEAATAAGGDSVLIVAAQLRPEAATPERFEALAKALGADGEPGGGPPSRGVLGEHAWWASPSGAHLVRLPGDRVVLASPLDAGRVVALHDGSGGKAVTARKDLRRYLKVARKGDPALWSASLVSERARDRAKARGDAAIAAVLGVTFRGDGDAGMAFELAGHTGSKKAAKALAQRVIEELDEKVYRSATLKLLGVAGLVKQAEPVAKGKMAVGRFELTKEQIGFLASVAPTIAAVLGGRKK